MGLVLVYVCLQSSLKFSADIWAGKGLPSLTSNGALRACASLSCQG